jgi:hypothetical protein
MKSTSASTTFLAACQNRRDTRSSASASEQPPAKRRKVLIASSERSEHNVTALLNATGPLLELFADLDVVFGHEIGALSPEQRQVTVGKVYDLWKRAKKQLDPDYKSPSQRGRT